MSTCIYVSCLCKWPDICVCVCVCVYVVCCSDMVLPLLHGIRQCLAGFTNFTFIPPFLTNFVHFANFNRKFISWKFYPSMSVILVSLFC